MPVSTSIACCSPSTGALVALEQLQQLRTDPKSFCATQRAGPSGPARCFECW